MELKPGCIPFSSSQPILLIVPYGIETEDRSLHEGMEPLLIVPYGIET